MSYLPNVTTAQWMELLESLADASDAPPRLPDGSPDFPALIEHANKTMPLAFAELMAELPTEEEYRQGYRRPMRRDGTDKPTANSAST
jgi:hypothetical protein